MPLVSQMLIHARGTRGAPRKPRGPGLLREASISALDVSLRRIFTELSIARPELGLPFRCSEFADVLLGPRADLRADFPLISPRAAIALLGEVALLDRRRHPHMPGLADYLATVAQRLHLAMTRYLCAHRENAMGAVLVEPNIDPGRWVPAALRRGPLAAVLCDALRSALMLEMERRLRDPVMVWRTRLRPTVFVHVLGCVRYRHELWHKQLRAQCCNELGSYVDHPATVRPLAPLGSWHWLAGFINRHRALVQAVMRAVAPDPDGADEYGQRLAKWLRRGLRTALRRSGAMPGLRRAIRDSLPYRRDQLELACRIRRDPGMPMCAADLLEVLRAEPDYRALRSESPTLLHLCSLTTDPDRPGRPNVPQRLKSQLRELGLGRAGWRLVCRHGVRAYAALMEGERDRDNIAAIVIAGANLIAACQRPGLPPVELMRQLGELEHENDTGDPLVPMPLLRAAWDAALALPTRHARRAFAAGAFARAATWWRSARDRPAIPPGIPWAWFDARTTAWEQRERALRTTDALQWTGPVAAFECQGVRVVPLESLVALWDEGLAMRHCVGGENFAKACLAGTRRVYSLRDARSGRRLATASCLRKPGEAWRLGQVAGFANRDAGRADVLAASRELLHAINATRDANRVDESTVTGDGARAA